MAWADQNAATATLREGNGPKTLNGQQGGSESDWIIDRCLATATKSKRSPFMEVTTNQM